MDQRIAAIKESPRITKRLLQLGDTIALKLPNEGLGESQFAAHGPLAPRVIERFDHREIFQQSVQFCFRVTEVEGHEPKRPDEITFGCFGHVLRRPRLR